MDYLGSSLAGSGSSREVGVLPGQHHKLCHRRQEGILDSRWQIVLQDTRSITVLQNAKLHLSLGIEVELQCLDDSTGSDSVCFFGKWLHRLKFLDSRRISLAKLVYVGQVQQGPDSVLVDDVWTCPYTPLGVIVRLLHRLLQIVQLWWKGRTLTSLSKGRTSISSFQLGLKA